MDTCLYKHVCCLLSVHSCLALNTLKVPGRGGGGASEDQGQRGQPGRIPVSDPRPTIQRDKEKEAERLKHRGGIGETGEQQDP